MSEIRQWIEAQFDHAARSGVEDLYFWPKDQKVRLVERRHHEFKERTSLTSEKMLQVVVYLKYLANMDVAETQKIQMGACTLELPTGRIRIRISVVPDYQRRESLVVRLLPVNQQKKSTLFPSRTWREICQQTYKRGLYLFIGPTGSGKTTLMYRLARERAKNEAHVITIEDPVEINEATFLQLQVNEKQALTYETLIKVCLRHRPDILVVGEIRDVETAQMVVRASLTGHVVFSTLHAEHAGQVVSRLAELGVSQHEITSVLRGVVTQRICGFQVTGKAPIKRQYGSLVSWSECPHEMTADFWIKTLRRGWYCGLLSEAAYWREQPYEKKRL